METATEASPDDASPADDADVYDVVLFYAYTSIENPEAVVATLKEFLPIEAAASRDACSSPPRASTALFADDGRAETYRRFKRCSRARFRDVRRCRIRSLWRRSRCFTTRE